MRIVGLFFCLIFSYGLSFAHTPDEIHYEFNWDAKGIELKVHLTPTGLVRLVQSIEPSLASQTTFKLEEHLVVMERYFQETCVLMVHGKPMRLHLKQQDLYSHDASLVFDLEGEIPTSAEQFDLKLTSFVGLYKRLKNTVVFKRHSKRYLFYLNANETQLSFKMSQLNAKKSRVTSWGFGGALLVLIGALLCNKQIYYFVRETNRSKLLSE